MQQLTAQHSHVNIFIKMNYYHFISNNKIMKCKVKECNKKSVSIIGECKFCQGKYCLNHRLVETHQCPCMESCRQQALLKNANTLLKNKCTSSKINII